MTSDLADIHAEWPNRAASRYVDAGGLRWHVQELGVEGPELLLLHGTGAATNSWASMAPLLAEHFRVIAPDLPGHGFTDPSAREQQSLPGMAQSVASLLDALEASPRLVIGHSAGAAVLVRMTLDDLIQPEAIVAFNGALLPFEGLMGKVFPRAARVLASLPVLPALLARRSARSPTDRSSDRADRIPKRRSRPRSLPKPVAVAPSYPRCSRDDGELGSGCAGAGYSGTRYAPVPGGLCQ